LRHYAQTWSPSNTSSQKLSAGLNVESSRPRDPRRKFASGVFPHVSIWVASPIVTTSCPLRNVTLHTVSAGKAVRSCLMTPPSESRCGAYTHQIPANTRAIVTAHTAVTASARLPAVGMGCEPVQSCARSLGITNPPASIFREKIHASGQDKLVATDLLLLGDGSRNARGHS
jgi:hypothetical protein